MKSTTEKFDCVTARTLLEWRKAAGVTYFRTAQIERHNEVTRRLKEKLTKEERTTSDVDDQKSVKTTRNDHYSEQLRQEILSYYELHGIAATCRKFDVSNASIYGWLRHGTKSRRKARYSTETRLKAVDVMASHGVRVASSSLGLPAYLLKRWAREQGTGVRRRKKIGREKIKDGCVGTIAGADGDTEDRTEVGKDDKFKNSNLGCVEKEEEVISVKKSVLEEAARVGLAKAAATYSLPLATVWCWMDQQKQESQLRARGLRLAERKQCSEETKSEVVEHYLQHGGLSCTRKYSIPRQTVRNWALRRVYLV